MTKPTARLCTLAALLGLALPVGCGGVGPERLVLAGSYRVWSNTDDGWAIASDDAGTAWAVRLADGSKQKIADQMITLSVQNNVAFIWHGTLANGVHAPLAVWSAAGGAHELDPSVGAYQLMAVSDGSHLAWLGNVDDNRQGGDLVVDTLDHQAPHVIGQIAITGCMPMLRFVGHRLIVGSCPIHTQDGSVASIDPDTASSTTLLAPARSSFAVDRANQRVAVVSPTGDAALVPAAGGTPQPLASNFAEGRFTADGSAIFYADGSGALLRLPIGGVAVALPGAQGSGPFDVSPDGRSVQFSPPASDNGNGYSIALGGIGQPALPLVPTNTGAQLGNGFTADSSFTLYAKDIDADYNGQIWAQSVAGGPARKLADFSFGWTTLGRGAQLLYTEHLVEDTSTPGGLADGTVDLSYLDLAGNHSPVTLLRGVEATVQPTPDQKALVYARRGSSGTNGIYETPLIAN